MTNGLQIEDLRPAGMLDYMMPAWLGLVHFALGQPEIVAAYRETTGDTWRPGKTPIDRMVDEATGRDRVFVQDFIGWVNVALW